MADNVNITAGVGTTIATDEVPGVGHFQKTKLADGTPDSTNMAVVNAAGELAVARNDAIVSGTMAAAGATVTIPVNGDATVTVQIAGTHVGNNLFEGTLDGTNWVSVTGVSPVSGSNQIQAPSNGVYQVPNAGFAQIRMRRSVHTSGSVSVTMRASVAANVVSLGAAIPVGSNQIGYVTASGVSSIGQSASTAPVMAGVRSQTANPTAVATGQINYAMADKLGRIVVVQGHVRDMCDSQATTITSTTATTVVTAGGAGVFTDITAISIISSSATATVAILSDGTKSYRYPIAAGGGLVQSFNTPRKATSANVAWTVALTVAVSSVEVSIDYVKNL